MADLSSSVLDMAHQALGKAPSLRFLEREQRVVAGRGKAERLGEALTDVVQLSQVEMGGSLGVGQGAVRSPGGGQPVPGAQGAEPVVGRLRMEAARKQQGAGEAMRVVGRALRALGFGVPEGAIERGVVSDERRALGEARQLVHDRARRRGAFEHGIADAGEPLDERRHPGAGTHQALEATDDLAAPDQHRRHFGGAAAPRRRLARGLEIDDGDGFQRGSKVAAEGSAARPVKPWPFLAR